MSAMNSKQVKIAQRIANAADEGGTLQAGDMLRLTRAGLIPNDPRLHTASSLRNAWASAGLDPDECERALWG